MSQALDPEIEPMQTRLLDLQRTSIDCLRCDGGVFVLGLRLPFTRWYAAVALDWLASKTRTLAASLLRRGHFNDQNKHVFDR